MEFHEMLRKMVIEKASDLIIKVGCAPSLRIDGAIQFLDTDEVTPQESREIFEIIEDSKKVSFDTKQDVDVAYETAQLTRNSKNACPAAGPGMRYRLVAWSVSASAR